MNNRKLVRIDVEKLALNKGGIKWMQEHVWFIRDNLFKVKDDQPVSKDKKGKTHPNKTQKKVNKEMQQIKDLMADCAEHTQKEAADLATKMLKLTSTCLSYKGTDGIELTAITHIDKDVDLVECNKLTLQNKDIHAPKPKQTALSREEIDFNIQTKIYTGYIEFLEDYLQNVLAKDKKFKKILCREISNSDQSDKKAHDLAKRNLFAFFVIDMLKTIRFGSRDLPKPTSKLDDDILHAIFTVSPTMQQRGLLGMDKPAVPTVQSALQMLRDLNDSRARDRVDIADVTNSNAAKVEFESESEQPLIAAAAAAAAASVATSMPVVDPNAPNESAAAAAALPKINVAAAQSGSDSPTTPPQRGLTRTLSSSGRFFKLVHSREKTTPPQSPGNRITSIEPGQSSNGNLANNSTPDTLSWVSTPDWTSKAARVTPLRLSRQGSVKSLWGVTHSPNDSPLGSASSKPSPSRVSPGSQQQLGSQPNLANSSAIQSDSSESSNPGPFRPGFRATVTK